jgi:hypothetical protein
MTYRTMGALVFASTLLIGSMGTPAIGTETPESELHLVSGTLMKLDLSRGKGLLTTDLGRPIYFEVPKAYLFENVTVGARIALRLDEYGRAIKVMDTSVPDVILSPDATGSAQPIAASLHGSMSETQ